MVIPQLIAVLSSFNPKEWDDCQGYLRGLLLEDSRQLKLFRYLNNNRDLCIDANWDLNKVMSDLSPELTRKSFQNQMYRLEDRITKYIINAELGRANHDFEKRQMLLSFYHSKSLFSLYRKELKGLADSLSKSPQFDLSIPVRKLFLHHASYFTELPFEVHRDTQHLSEGRRQLENYYRAMVSLYEAEQLSISEKHTSITEQIQEDKENQLVRIMKSIYLLILTREEHYFIFLKSQLIELHQEMSVELKKIILIYLVNHCYYDTKHNMISRHKELSDLFHFGILTSLLLEDGKMGVGRFLNMVEVFSKDCQTSIDVIQEILPKVNLNGLENVDHLSYAIWNCSKENYDEALQHLRFVNISRFNYSLARRIYWVKLCCLGSIQSNHQNMKEVLHTARVFFNRQKKRINERDYQGSMNLIQIISMMLKGKPREQIQNYIMECQYLVCVDWVHKRLKKYDPLS